MKSDSELSEIGFTQSGLKRYKDAVADFESTLLTKAVAYAQLDKAPNNAVEVTHDHVRAGAHSMAGSLGKKPQSPWLVPVQIGEYLGTLVAGIGGGNLASSWGTPTFIGAAAAVVMLFVVRHTRLKQP